MDSIWKLFNGIVSLATALLVILIILGLIFSENIRSNVIYLYEELASSGIIGIYVSIILIYMVLGSVLSISLAIINARGINKKFISTFFNVQSEKLKFFKWANRVIYIFLPLSIFVYYYFSA